ncbi:MAG: DUF1330 domain-containing protein [Thermoanaerobaculia bacterium]
MSAYVLVDVVVRDPAKYESYKALVPPSIAAYGGRFIVRGGAVEELEGSWKPSRLVILEFPSAERARAWWSSPEYAEAKALRLATATSKMILVEGLPPA